MPEVEMSTGSSYTNHSPTNITININISNDANPSAIKKVLYEILNFRGHKNINLPSELSQHQLQRDDSG